ncbi:MAG TPA: 4Fe-4S binding protein [Candidatus Methanofastidiosa archaeon]|nr:4Fe-4S binding protein [Candidatus Methanofastidiosa archaeon]
MKARRMIQWMTLLASLAVLFFMVRTKREPLAITLMLLLSAGSVFYGRLFCGYLCPFHAYDKMLGAVLGRLGIRRIDSGRLDGLRAVFYMLSVAILAILVMKALMPYTKIRVQIPILMLAFVFLTPLAPRIWHRYVCPFGLIMRLPAAARPLMPKISSSCKHCKACEKVCPTDAITVGKDDAGISGAHCILCYRCEDACKHDSIRM